MARQTIIGSFSSSIPAKKGGGALVAKQKGSVMTEKGGGALVAKQKGGWASVA